MEDLKDVKETTWDCIACDNPHAVTWLILENRTIKLECRECGFTDEYTFKDCKSSESAFYQMSNR